jgi:hypothetical protein
MDHKQKYTIKEMLSQPQRKILPVAKLTRLILIPTLVSALDLHGFTTSSLAIVSYQTNRASCPTKPYGYG